MFNNQKELEFAVMQLQNMERGFSYSESNVSNPPTDAELDGIFGNASDLYNGFVGIVNDSGADTNVYHVAVSNSKWWYVALTQAS